jgi:hypothetical protein
MWGRDVAIGSGVNGINILSNLNNTGTKIARALTGD